MRVSSFMRRESRYRVTPGTFVGLAIAPVQSPAGADLGSVTPGDFERAPVFEVIGPATEVA